MCFPKRPLHVSCLQSAFRSAQRQELVSSMDQIEDPDTGSGLRTGNHIGPHNYKTLLSRWEKKTTLKILINYVEPIIIEFLTLLIFRTETESSLWNIVFYIKYKTIANTQNLNNCINVPSSHTYTYRSYLLWAWSPPPSSDGRPVAFPCIQELNLENSHFFLNIFPSN
jgi:hypothetical protein